MYVCVYVSMYICMHTYSPNHHFPVVFSLKAWCHHSFSPLKTPVGAPASQHPLVDLSAAPQGGMRIEWIEWRLNRIDWHVIIRIFGLYFIYIYTICFVLRLDLFCGYFSLQETSCLPASWFVGVRQTVPCRPTTGLSKKRLP